MAWTTPAQRATGFLVTSSVYNTDIIDNIAYLKGQAGAITIEDDIVGDDATHDIGSAAIPYAEGHFDKLFASHAKHALHKYIRHQTFTWEDDIRIQWQIATANGGNGDYDSGGTGQAVIWVANNNADSIYLANLVEQNSAFDMSWNAGRNPYWSIPFVISAVSSDLEVFIGLRQTIGLATPLAAAEKYAGLFYNGTNWVAKNSEGTEEDTSGSLTVGNGARHVLEILIVDGTSVEYWIDGVLVQTSTARLPTGDMDWQLLLLSDGGGAATTTYLTIGRSDIQEDLS